jgi:hypothetical protein
MNETKDIFIEIVKKYNLDMNLDEEELKNKKGWSSK